MPMSIVIPILREPEIESFLDDLHAYLDRLPCPYEIVVVTSDKEVPRVCLKLRNDQKNVVSYGDSLERAILVGISAATYLKVIVMDADGSHPKEKLEEIMDALDSSELCVASRYIAGGKPDHSAFREIVSRFFIFLAHLRGSKLTDPMSGFFGFRRYILCGMGFKPITWKTCLEIELRAHPHRVKEIPIEFKDRKVGLSKTTFLTGLKLIRDLVFWKKLPEYNIREDDSNCRPTGNK